MKILWNSPWLNISNPIFECKRQAGVKCQKVELEIDIGNYDEIDGFGPLSIENKFDEMAFNFPVPGLTDAFNEYSHPKRYEALRQIFG